MPGIKWAHERELTQTLGGEAEGGGRLTETYGTEASLQLDESLFRKGPSDHGNQFGRNGLLGNAESHFNSSDLAIFDGFGDDPQEADEEDLLEEEKCDEKISNGKAKEKGAEGSESTTVDQVSKALDETNLTATGNEKETERTKNDSV